MIRNRAGGSCFQLMLNGSLHIILWQWFAFSCSYFLLEFHREAMPNHCPWLVTITERIATRYVLLNAPLRPYQGSSDLPILSSENLPRKHPSLRYRFLSYANLYSYAGSDSTSTSGCSPELRLNGSLFYRGGSSDH